MIKIKGGILIIYFKLLLMIFILLPFRVFSQFNVDNNDKFKLVFKNSTTILNFGEIKNSSYHISTYAPELKKVRVRILAESYSKSNETFDPNKLYLISNELKLRIRPIDVQYRYFINSYFGAKRLTADSTVSDGTAEIWLADVDYIRYDPKIKDTFKDYTIPGYQDLEVKVDYGSRKKPQPIVAYFEHIEIISYTIDIYFIVPKSLKNGEFYCGDRKIIQCSFD
jgi:hypothetical protein